MNRKILWLACVTLSEVAALTPFVEIPAGPLAWVANHQVCAGLLTSCAAIFVIRRSGVVSHNVADSRDVLLCFCWIVANATFYIGLFAFSMWLSENPTSVTMAWLAAAVWIVLASGVGISSVLIFFSARQVVIWLRQQWAIVLAAGALGMAVAISGPWIQGLWPEVCGPALAMDFCLLRWIYGEGFAGTTAEGLPVLGTSRLSVLVTPGCSALDSLPALWLLAAAVFGPRWRELRKPQLAIGLALATTLVYVINAVRLVGLVVISTAISPNVCVGVAHSQLSVIGFLLFDVAVLAGLNRLCLEPGRLGCWRARQI